mmetsp:Transcript_66600/g.215285  ORF Transcript_66600/g.215285 Transcript_66600/m.215285 type:complete len:224 (-) Transcript_66600:701-1372(-)
MRSLLAAQTSWLVMLISWSSYPLSSEPPHADPHHKHCEDVRRFRANAILSAGVLVSLGATFCKIAAGAVHGAGTTACKVHVKAFPSDAQRVPDAGAVEGIRLVCPLLKLTKASLGWDASCPTSCRSNLPTKWWLEWLQTSVCQGTDQSSSPLHVSPPRRRVFDAEHAPHVVANGQTGPGARLDARASERRLRTRVAWTRAVLRAPVPVRGAEKGFEPRVLRAH